MGNNQVVIDTLIKKRDDLMSQRDAATRKFNEQIEEIEEALDKLAGKEVWRNADQTVYDDENPDYIRQSQEEI
jgi:hypothetical protein